MDHRVLKSEAQTCFSQFVVPVGLRLIPVELGGVFARTLGRFLLFFNDYISIRRFQRERASLYFWEVFLSKIYLEKTDVIVGENKAGIQVQTPAFLIDLCCFISSQPSFPVAARRAVSNVLIPRFVFRI